jgi:hypothetical protein
MRSSVAQHSRADAAWLRSPALPCSLVVICTFVARAQIPYDTQVLGYPVIPAPVVPTYMVCRQNDSVHPRLVCFATRVALANDSVVLLCVQSFDWLSGLRTGAWEESSLRGPRGELDDEKKDATLKSTDPLVIHANLPTHQTDGLTSPAHTSTALLDTDVQTSKPAKPVPAAAAPSSPTKSLAVNVASPASRSSASNSANFVMPQQLISYHPIAQQHALTSSSALSVPCEIIPNTETSYNAAFRSSITADSPETGYYYNKEFAANGGIRTLPTMPSLQAIWRPRREPAINLGILEDVSRTKVHAREPRDRREDTCSILIFSVVRLISFPCPFVHFVPFAPNRRRTICPTRTTTSTRSVDSTQQA